MHCSSSAFVGNDGGLSNMAWDKDVELTTH